MAEAKNRQAWAHTSALLALIANCHRDPKKTRPFTPADFDPHRRGKKSVTTKAGIAVLKQVFVD
jgi:ferric-dicitrate binding protein FerR (iron transport regulator)